MFKQKKEVKDLTIIHLHEDNIIEAILLTGMIILLVIGWVKILNLNHVMACQKQSEKGSNHLYNK